MDLRDRARLIDARTMSDFSIRALRLADLAQVRELAVLAEAEGFQFVRRFADELSERSIALDAPCEFFLATLADDRVIAIGGVTADPYVGDPHVGRLRHLYVRPDARGAGVGRELVARLEIRARDCYDVLRLRTDAAGAAAFYECLGYSPMQAASATHSRVL
jgi:GNAT superfamily N-acetyltransferase